MMPCAFFFTLTAPSSAQEADVNDPVRQPEPAAYISMTNLGGAFDFNEDNWRAAVARAGARIYWKIDYDSVMATRVMEVAASAENDPPFAALFVANLPIDQIEAFDQLLDGLLGEDASDDFAGAEFIMREPLCRLMRLAEPEAGGVQEYYVATIDRSDERLACYSKTIAYVLANPDAFQPPPLERIVVDAAAVLSQAILPQVSVKESDFIEPDTWQNDRRVAARNGDAVFASGEMIMLHAILENVGRDLVGTPLASYEIRLDVEIRDAQDNVFAAQQDVMRFSGSPIHSVPVRQDYFETGIVAGFPLEQPGKFQIIYRLTDLNRPEENAVVEIIKQVTIR